MVVKVAYCEFAFQLALHRNRCKGDARGTNQNAGSLFEPSGFELLYLGWILECRFMHPIRERECYEVCNEFSGFVNIDVAVLQRNSV